MSEEISMDFPADEHSKILRKRWEDIKAESDSVDKKERKVRGGQYAEYLPWHTVSQILNVCAPDWEFEVNKVESIYGESRAKGFAEATVTLRILGIARQDIGISEFGGANNQSEDNARKGAVRLALVRAANLFGVGCDIKENNANQNGQNNRTTGNRNNNFSNGSNRNSGQTANNSRNTAKSGSNAGQPLNFEAPKLRSDIRQLMRDMSIKEDAAPVVKIIQEELGCPTLDKCSDVSKLTKLKSRIEKKKGGGTASGSSSVPPIEAGSVEASKSA